MPQLKITNIQANPVEGGQVTGQAAYEITPTGQIRASLKAEQMPGDAIAQLYGASPALTVGPVDAQVTVVGAPTSPKTTAEFQAPLALYATEGSVVIERDVTQLRNIVSQVAQGKVFTEGKIQDGQLWAQIQPRGLVLETFSPELKGLLDGSLQVSTPLENASAQTLRACGRKPFVTATRSC
ncbi:MAG: hypothetical protein HC810_02075 [Acaryochloridaceae cyanobacterium RL_2_7]|nr:hypothetical protein [Acaryochloridaceae cyanobacterium RL_2_7]